MNKTERGAGGQTGSFPHSESLRSLRAKRSISHEHQNRPVYPRFSSRHLKSVILSGAGRLFLPRLLLQTLRPAQRRISLPHRALLAR